ncbi:MAG: murein biosynthesis integral membrane protein MurJ [Candidatus Omnitrophica bacterium]|nr:murein biosynthesis integral membrane protein MurJ [Candidatus Omnitrophota bacterium]
MTAASDHARIAASTRAISLATAASRILGFIRDLLIAKLFGTGIQAQAFVVAFRLPNLFRDLVAEGAMTAAVVPVLSAYRATRSAQDFWRLAQATAVRVLVLVGVLMILGAACAPWLVTVVAPGFVSEPEKFALTVQVTRVLFPFILLVALWAFFCGLLNTLRQFAVPALGPAVLNVVVIAGCLWVAPRVNPPVLGVAWAVMAGGLAQLLMQLPVASAHGFRWRWVWRHPDGGRGEVMRLLTPRLLGAAVYQVSVLFNTMLASLGALAGEGAVAALYFANRLVQLPLALFATSSAQASLPHLSERAAVNDLAEFRATLVTVLRIVLFESLPAAVGLMALSAPIVQVCFERGAFDRGATVMTAQTLVWLALGLIAYAAGRVLTGAFYALQDTATPVKLAMEALVVNVVLAVLFLKPMQVGGLALATALSSSLNAWRLLAMLERRLGEPLVPHLLRPALRMGLAAAAMGAGCALAWQRLAPVIPPLAALSVIIPGGIMLYGTISCLIGVEECSAALRWLARLVTRQPSSRA